MPEHNIPVLSDQYDAKPVLGVYKQYQEAPLAEIEARIVRGADGKPQLIIDIDESENDMDVVVFLNDNELR